MEVNGSVGNARPFTEEDEPNPQTNYGSSKFKAESELLRIANATGLEVVIIRPPLIYGPGKMGNLLDAIISCCNSPPAPPAIYFL
ncbi:MAG: NAD-dependent epimerase/dehydratase family protein [Thermoleophilia bacterium]